MFLALAPMSSREREAFAEAQIADYADWLLLHARAGSPCSAQAQAQARAEIRADLAAGALAGDLFWTASASDTLALGWLWVKCTVPGLPPGAAFLYQIQVVTSLRRQGYGRAMLAALEHQLATMGYRELRLNVWDSNAPARQLYEAAGYQLIEQLAGKRQLGKHLPPSPTGPPP